MAVNVPVFVRSLVDFDRLATSEIVGRLFFWWFGPGFLLLGVEFSGVLPKGVASATPATAIGVALTFVVVARDAYMGRLPKPFLWAVFSAFVPLIGWLFYGRARSGEGLREHARPVTIPGRGSAIQRYLNPFWSYRRRLVTALSAEACAERLRARTVRWFAIGDWFSLHDAKPFQDSVSRRGFSLRIRHTMTRPSMTTEASGRLESQVDGTIIYIRFGLSVLDRALWIGMMLFFLIAGVSTGFLFLLLFMVALVAVIRAIARDDDLALYGRIASELQARAID